MRLFEILILGSLFPIIIWPLLRLPRYRQLKALPVASLLFVILHLLIEQYRWQMVPAYGLTSLLLIAELWRWRSGSSGSGRRWLSNLITFVGMVVFLLAAALPALMPVPKLPQPSGPYAIGTASYHLVDSSRPEFYTDDPDDFREFMMQVWYPAVAGDGEGQAEYIDRLDIAGPAFATWLELPPFILDHINLTKTDAVKGLPVLDSGSPYPIIFFSHGLHGFRSQNISNIQELVSRGYVLISIDHTYANMISVFPGDRVTFYEEDIFSDETVDPPRNANTLVKVWAGDIGFALDQLTAWNSQADNFYYEHLEPAVVGLFGHSTGGGAAVEFCARDSRCQAGIGLDSWIEPVSGDIFADGLMQPFMFLSSSEWLGEDNSALGRTLYGHLQSSGYMLTLNDTEHFDFSDLTLLSPLTPQLGLTGAIDGPYSIAIQNQYIAAFFDKHLKQADVQLLSQTSAYPELQVEQNGR